MVKNLEEKLGKTARSLATAGVVGLASLTGTNSADASTVSISKTGFNIGADGTVTTSYALGGSNAGDVVGIVFGDIDAGHLTPEGIFGLGNYIASAGGIPFVGSATTALGNNIQPTYVFNPADQVPNGSLTFSTLNGFNLNQPLNIIANHNVGGDCDVFVPGQGIGKNYFCGDWNYEPFFQNVNFIAFGQSLTGDPNVLGEGTTQLKGYRVTTPIPLPPAGLLLLGGLGALGALGSRRKKDAKYSSSEGENNIIDQKL